MLLPKELMCWTVEQSDVSCASVSINTEYCIVKTTNKILSVTGKIADNKLENIITEMLSPACNGIMCNLLHVTYCLARGVFMCLSLPLLTLLVCSPPSKLPLGYFWKPTHWIYHHFVAGQSCHTALELLGIAGPEPLFEWKSEAGDVRRRNCLRQLGVTSAKQISSLQLTKSFFWDEAGFGQYLVVSL